MAVDDAATTAEDTPVTIAVLANDSDLDGDTLTVSGVTQPAHGTAVVNADGTITYTPAANYNGPDSFTYTVSDGHGGSATATVSVTVTRGERRAGGGGRRGDDGGGHAGQRSRCSPTTATWTATRLTVSGVTQPAHGTATVNARRHDHLHAGRELQRPRQLHLHGQRRPRRHRRRRRSASRSRAVERRAGGGERRRDDGRGHAGHDRACSANDSDLDGDSADRSAASAGRRTARRSLNADGTITYTPAANYNGPDSFTYTVSDGHGGSATATVTVTVTRGRTTRRWRPTTRRRRRRTRRSRSRCSANDTRPGRRQPDGRSVAHGPAHGTRRVNADGTLTYTPAANYSGPDSFTYTVSDGHGGIGDGDGHASRSARSNDAPVAADDAATTAEDTPVSDRACSATTATSTATRLDGQRRRARPAHGTVDGQPDGTITYTPAANYSGPDSFTYTVSDGHGGVGDGDGQRHGHARSNDAPVAADDAATTAEDTPVTIAVLANDSDLDGDTPGRQQRRRAGARRGDGERGRHGDLHAGGELQRPRQLHLHGERRPRRDRRRRRSRVTVTRGERRAGRRRTTRRRRRKTRRSRSRCWQRQRPGRRHA